jgi:hypothetical protein
MTITGETAPVVATMPITAGKGKKRHILVDTLGLLLHAIVHSALVIGKSLVRRLTEAFPWDAAPKYLTRDNDGAYGEVFRRRLRSMGIRERPISPRSPWQNCYVERVIGSIRRECLDHAIIWNAAHLRHILNAYTHYYNATRTHLGLRKDAPNHRSIERSGTIAARDILSGLHHQYCRI